MRPTIWIVKYYSTKAMKGGVEFLCTLCEYKLTTRDFRRENGNCRTQAATAMNQHVHDAHRQSVPPITTDLYERLWRA